MPTVIVDDILALVREIIADHVTVVVADSDGTFCDGAILQRRFRLWSMPNTKRLCLGIEILDIECSERSKADTSLPQEYDHDVVTACILELRWPPIQPVEPAGGSNPL